MFTTVMAESGRGAFISVVMHLSQYCSTVVSKKNKKYCHYLQTPELLSLQPVVVYTDFIGKSVCIT